MTMHAMTIAMAPARSPALHHFQSQTKSRMDTLRASCGQASRAPRHFRSGRGARSCTRVPEQELNRRDCTPDRSKLDDFLTELRILAEIAFGVLGRTRIAVCN